MSSQEVTGSTEVELAELREDYKDKKSYKDYDIPFEVAYCLSPIGKQPDEYDGPQRYCTRRVGRRDEYDCTKHDPGAFMVACRFHGGPGEDAGGAENLDEPRTAPIKHGMWAEDESLRMDFNDAEQTLYDSIVEAWPEAYNWPDEEEDPARYLMLRKVATNVVRTNRAEDYLDDEGEVHLEPVFEEGIEVGEKETENPLAREYRLLVDEIISMLKELGLTPKERAKMDKVEAEAGAAEQVADLASDALDSDREYDPTEFDDDDGET